MTEVWDHIDRAIIRATQAGLPLVARPYAKVAEEAGVSEAEVMSRMGRMQDAGLIRRIGIVPNHYALGLCHNAMTVWDVDDTMISELGRRVGALVFVTHCYQRPRRLPLWPYNLFAMVHGRTPEEVDGKTEAIAQLLDGHCRARDVLVSTRVLKKTGMRLRAKAAGPPAGEGEQKVI
ncbi:MAG: AsnC family transcriptional regulator [Hyphomicrobiaceae bacterium]|nr:AsnC family transcriptional regulator [Hyphomicrobiaceae bacterium]